MDLLELLKELFKDKPLAFNWLCLYVRYVHAIDDSIDEEFSSEKICESHYIASLLFSSDYFIAKRDSLGSLFHSILSQYATTVKWESQEDKKQWSDILRHCGVDMLLLVIRIEFGWEKAREFDPVLREKVLLS